MPLLIYLYSLLPLSNELDVFLGIFGVKCLIWSLVNLYIYHFIAGVRHMIADFGHDHSLTRANQSALAVIFISAIFAAWTGALIW